MPRNSSLLNKEDGGEKMCVNCKTCASEFLCIFFRHADGCANHLRSGCFDSSFGVCRPTICPLAPVVIAATARLDPLISYYGGTE